MDRDIIESIISKSRMKIAISKFEESNTKNAKKNISKLVATFILATAITSGLVYGAGSAIEQIWKKPETYTISQEITNEEKEKCISEEKAKEISNEYLKKIGLEDETIQALGLSRTVVESEPIWNVYTEKVSIKIDAQSGKVKQINIPTWKYKIPYNYGITREEARIVAKQLLEKYKPEEDNGEYELISLKRNEEPEEEAYIWYAEFYKKYDNLINPAESIKIGWVPTINGLYSLNIESYKYENNEQKISQEEAIKIATQRDNQIETQKTIKDTKAEIRIKQMNAEVYLRENYKEEYENGTLNMEKIGQNVYKLDTDAVMYKTEKRVRKVWCVVIYYDIDKNADSYTYYVDSTTGEIIGGQRSDVFENEKNLIEDPHNVIEK